MKRLAISFCALTALLCLAGILSLLQMMMSEKPYAIAEQFEESETANSLHAEEEESAESHEMVSAEELVRRESVVVNGQLLDRTHAHLLVNGMLEQRPIERIEQDVLPSGCEIIALSAALRIEGFEASPEEIAKDHLAMGENVACEYIGTPFDDGGGLPPCITDAANSWLGIHDLPARAYDITGTTFDGLVELSALGYPIVVWTTEGMDDPEFIGVEVDGYQWYVCEHAVVLTACLDDEVAVLDSLDETRLRDLTQFKHVYEACGEKAVVVVPQS